MTVQVVAHIVPAEVPVGWFFTIPVVVTDTHIARGIPCDVQHCPGALAILDALDAVGFDVNTGEQIVVCPDTVAVQWYAYRIQGPPPDLLRLFIAAVDNDDKDHVQPFSFDLTLQRTE